MEKGKIKLLSRENKIAEEGKQTCGRGKMKLWKRENKIVEEGK